jgi:tetratricopeptide (TPR) repeat protein
VKSWNPLSLMAWSLAFIALVLAVFLPLNYLELRKQAHLAVPSAPATQPVEPADGGPPPGTPPSNPSPPEDLSHPRTDLGYIKYINMGDFLMARDEYDDAISAYQDGLKHYPSNSELRQKLDAAIKSCKKENSILKEGLKCGAP